MAKEVQGRDDPRKARVFLAIVAALTGVGVGLCVRRVTSVPRGIDLAIWAVVVAIVELLPVPLSKALRLSLGFPILLGIAILYQPPVAAAVALLGSFDIRELRREITLVRAAFNRAQIALATWAASSLFHALASVHSGFILLPVAVLASAADYAVNISLVTMAMRLMYGLRVRQILDQFRAGAFGEFLLNYLVLGLVGVVIARLFRDESWAAVAAFILPLVFARQMFFRSLALEEAGKELKDRERVLRALSNRMAEERQDERMQIAGYLHDDLAQQLFRLTLQAEMAKKRLARGNADAALKDLDGILETKQQTSDMVRALIRDLHRSPIGRKGLAEAIQSFAEDMSRGAATSITTEVVEVTLPPPIQLLIYQIAREATMNALKHADAEKIWIALAESDDGVILTIRDNGKGFDVNQPQPEGHFGSVMMRERALVTGGTYDRTSAIGEGTTVRVTFPHVWVEEGAVLEATAPGESQTGPASPPTGTTVGPGPTSNDVTARGRGPAAVEGLAAPA